MQVVCFCKLIAAVSAFVVPPLLTTTSKHVNVKKSDKSLLDEILGIENADLCNKLVEKLFQEYVKKEELDKEKQENKEEVMNATREIERLASEKSKCNIL